MSDNTISDSAVMAALSREMTAATSRESVAMSNLVNVDTPGYKAQEVSFSHALDSQINSLSLAATNANHITSTPVSGSGVMTTSTTASGRGDGNNVQMDHELLAMSKAAGDFSAAQTVIAAKFRLVRYAINEGK